MARPQRRPKKDPKRRAKPAAGRGRPAGRGHPDLVRARAALESGDVVTAEVLCDELLEASPRDRAATLFRARLHTDRGQHPQALGRLRPLAARFPRDREVQRHLADALRRCGAHAQAVEAYERLRRGRGGDDLAVLEGMGTSLVMLGERDRVLALLEPHLESGEATPAMSVTYVRALVDARQHEAALQAVSAQLLRPVLRETHKRRLHALRGKALERLERFDEAFEAYATAATFERVPFDRERYRAEIDELIGFFTADGFAAAPPSKLATDAPIFIVGMPRSGSTLIERILDAHPQARAVGEHPAMFEIMERVKADYSLPGAWPAKLRGLTPAGLTRLGEEYLAAIRDEGDAEPSATPSRLVDKALWNTHAIGLIAMLFPNARIIWSRRRGEDACFSCFAESFAPHLAPYAADLGDLGFVHRELERLMEHWQAVLPIPLRAVQYEDVIADQEAASRALVEFAGLPWHDDCLRFFEKAAPADSLSHEQVRRPVYGSSVGRADRFEKHLSTLRDALR